MRKNLLYISVSVVYIYVLEREKAGTVKNHLVYSDKFIISVVNLNQIELATKEDQDYNIDYWARIFKAKTWLNPKIPRIEPFFIFDYLSSYYLFFVIL